MMPNGKLICTKPGNERRFRIPGNMAIRASLTDYAIFIYLPEESALAEKARSVGEFEYNPGFDIDRFAFECACGEGETDRCPAFKKLRELLAAKAIDGRCFDPSFVPIEFKEDLENGKRHVTRVCHGDGRCGPIAFKYEDGLEVWPELRAACAKCDKHSNDCAGNSNNGNDKCAHGRIIAFLKRIFGR